MLNTQKSLLNEAIISMFCWNVRTEENLSKFSLSSACSFLLTLFSRFADMYPFFLLVGKVSVLTNRKVIILRKGVHDEKSPVFLQFPIFRG